MSEQTVFGIDVSEHQGEIDWKKINDVPPNTHKVKYAFIKATEGATIRDKKAFRNISEATGENIPVGIYHFAYPQRKENDAKEEAQAFLSCLDTLPASSLGHVLDIEVNKENMKLEKLLAWVEEFIAEFFSSIPDQDFYIYSYPSFLNGSLPKDHTLGRFPLWIANYGVLKPTIPHGWSECKIWQYTEQGNVPGIKTKVDLNWADPSILIGL